MERYQKVLETALQLPEDERQLLAEVIRNSVHPQSQEWRDTWREETERRMREFEANPSSGIPWEEAKAFARRRAGLS
jgi:putative addiction module component (TIGR02574 family)